LKHLHTIDVSGIPGMDKSFCQELANDLTEKCGGITVTVINTGSQGETSLDKCPYLPIPSSLSSVTPDEEKRNQTVASYSPMPGLEPLHTYLLSPSRFPDSVSSLSVPLTSRVTSDPSSLQASPRVPSRKPVTETDQGYGVYKPLPSSAVISQPRNIRAKTLPAPSQESLPRITPSLVSQTSTPISRRFDSRDRHNQDGYSSFQTTDIEAKNSPNTMFSKSSSFPPRPAKTPEKTDYSSSSSQAELSSSSSSSTSDDNYLAMDSTEILPHSSRISTVSTTHAQMF